MNTISTKCLAALILLSGILLLNSCSKEKDDVPMTVVREVQLTYKVFSTDSNAAEIKRTITFLSGWKMVADTLQPIYTDTVVTGDFNYTFTMKTLTDYFAAKGVCKTYSIPAALGWKWIESRTRFSHTTIEIDINGGFRTDAAGTCVADQRPAFLHYYGVDDWDWDGH